MTLIFRVSQALQRARTSASILTNLRRCKTIRSLQQVHPQIIRKGSHQDAFLMTQFISLCFTFSSDPSYPTSVFEWIKQPNGYLWNAMIVGYCRNSSSLSCCIVVFNGMRRGLGGLGSGDGDCAFPALIRRCGNAAAMREGEMVHGLALRYGSCSGVILGSSLVDFYGRCGDTECARKVFDEMPVRNEVSWTSLVVGCVNVGDVVGARKVFDEMPVRNLAAWNAMIGGFGKVGDLGSARRLFDEMPEKDVVSYTVMINAYAKSGDMVSARILFERTGKKDLVLWSALISGHAQNGEASEAMEMINKMHSAGIEPDEFVMVSLMSACSQLGCLEMAKVVDSYVHCSRFFHHGRVYVSSALIDMNVKCGNMERAFLLFEQLPRRDLVSYCSIIQGLSVHGNGPQAVEMFERMLADGIFPDRIAFTVILIACSSAGLVEEGCRYFDSMVKKYSLEPSADQYACIIDLLGRSGKIKTAYELLKSMPFEPNAGAWGALLGACKLYCEVELAEEIVRKLIELEPLNAGNYVMMSAIYAGADMWSEVSDVRQRMTKRGLRKIPGCTRIYDTPSAGESYSPFTSVASIKAGGE